MLELLFDRAEAKRKFLLKRAPSGPLRDYLSVPFPDKNLPIQQSPFLSVDFETTGLNAQKDHILSIGLVSVKGLSIQLASASHDIIRVDAELHASNVIIHKITDGEKDRGVPPEKAIARLLENLRGKVMLAHFSKTETEFLRYNCKRIYGMAPVIPVVDTFRIALNRLQKQRRRIEKRELRLFNLRRYYNLPEHGAHNALSDAISTAELFLAEIHHLPGGDNGKLSEILKYSYGLRW